MSTDAPDFERQGRGGTASAEDVLEGSSAESRSPEGILERYPSRYASRRSRMGSARSLGMLSVGLGLGGLLMPRMLGHVIGMPGHEGLLRFIGARELSSGAGLLTQRNAMPWLWSRVGGDVMDLAVLGIGLRPSNPLRGRTAGAAAVVAAITAVDVIASMRETRRPREAFRVARRAQDKVIEHTVGVNRSAQECYAYWRDVSNLPKFSQMLETVTPIDERRSHWVMRGPGDARIEWDAEITVDRPGERIAWRSLSGAVKHAGTVRFESAPGGRGTFVSAMMHYQPPMGRMSAAFAKMLGKDPNHQVREDLRRFKSLMETGEVPSTRGQSSGRRSFIGRMTRDGRESREGVRS